MSTLREHLFTIRELANGIYTTTDNPVLRIRLEVAAALAIIDAAERETYWDGLASVRQWEQPTDRVLICDPIAVAS